MPWKGGSSRQGDAAQRDWRENEQNVKGLLLVTGYYRTVNIHD